MAEQIDSTESLLQAATAVSKAAENLSTAATSMANTPSWVSWGNVSIGAVVGSFLGALAAFFVRRYFAKKDETELADHRRKETAIELHDRFNSAEVLKARAEAEKFLLEHTGERFQDIAGDDHRINSVWLVAREYEFMSIAIDEGIADKNIVAKYAFEIFVYWLQHFRFGFKDEKFDTVARIRAFEDFLRQHPSTKDRWRAMEDRQRKHLNRLLKAGGKREFDFSKAPQLMS